MYMFHAVKLHFGAPLLVPQYPQEPRLENKLRHFLSLPATGRLPLLTHVNTVRASVRILFHLEIIHTEAESRQEGITQFLQLSQCLLLLLLGLLRRKNFQSLYPCRSAQYFAASGVGSLWIDSTHFL